MAKETKEMTINRIMTGLKCSEAEAEKVYQYDYMVDHDQKTEFDLTPDKLKVARKMAHTGTRKTPTVYKFGKKERKPNATKSEIISELAQFLSEKSNFTIDNLEIVNKERQILFEIGGEKFELTLVQKRKPKS